MHLSSSSPLLLSSSLLTWHPLSLLSSSLRLFALFLILSLASSCHHISSPLLVSSCLIPSPPLSMKHPKIKHNHAHIHPAAAQLIPQWIYCAWQHSLWPWCDQSPLKGGGQRGHWPMGGELDRRPRQCGVWMWDQYQEYILVLFDSMIMFSS